MCNEDKQFELEKQLHEQYAINNNEHMSSLITLFVSLIAVLGAYGYVFLHSTIECATNLGTIYLEYEKYTIEALLLTASVCFIVIAVMQHLCIYQGSSQRKEQFIVYAIRQKSKMDEIIFPDGYVPYGKKQRNFVQGIYGELVKIFGIVQFILFITTLWKYLESNIDVRSITFECLVCFAVCFSLSFFYTKIYKVRKFLEYKKIEQDYKKNYE